MFGLDHFIVDLNQAGLVRRTAVGSRHACNIYITPIQLATMVLSKAKDGRPGIMSMTQVLLLANLVVISMTSYKYLSAIDDGSGFVRAGEAEEAFILPKASLLKGASETEVSAVSVTSDHPPESLKGPVIADTPPGGIGQLHSGGAYFVKPREGERDFYETAKTTKTDKVTAPDALGPCLKSGSCTRPGCVREACRPWGHHYDTIYQQRLGPYSRDDTAPFQFLGRHRHRRKEVVRRVKTHVSLRRSRILQRSGL